MSTDAALANRRNLLLAILFILICAVSALAQARKPGPPTALAQEKAVAAAFAPIFYQGLGDTPRLDYPTSFNFDRDWRGDNNWRNAEKGRFPLRAYVYYAVSETPTHYFIHYAVFHPVDYKGGRVKGRLLSGLIRAEVEKFGKYDPTKRAQDAVLAHENDLEGCLVVAEKRGDRPEEARVVYVETLAHNKFLKYVPQGGEARGFAEVAMEGQRPKLFIEPKGHGIAAYTGDAEQLKEAKSTLVYFYNGTAGDPEKLSVAGRCGYGLIPITTTLWARAQSGKGATYDEILPYAAITIRVSRSGQVSERRVTPGKLGAAFLGRMGAANMARPPWGWFDASERDQPPGLWFFDPAGTIKRHFNLGDEFSTVYLSGIAIKLKATAL